MALILANSKSSSCSLLYKTCIMLLILIIQPNVIMWLDWILRLSLIVQLVECFWLALVSGIRRKKFQGVQGYGRPRRGSGAEPPRLRRIFENLQKDFLRKLQKMHYLAYFQKNSKLCVKFCAFGRKTQLVGKFLRKFLMKIR